MNEINEIDVKSDHISKEIKDLVALCGGDPNSYSGELTLQMIQTCLRLMLEKHETGQLKLISRALKEMRYAYRIFNQYPNARCISIFGSARTPEDHPDYLAAKALSIAMGKESWMCITGAADGIMKAGLEGTQRAGSFGLSIQLPFEIPTNSVIEGDPKLMMFRYFFTRKLMFLSHAHAIAAFPGGFGTMDELFEALTLMHNGKSNIVPLVLVEGEGGSYWLHWKQYINEKLLQNGWISPEDQNLYFITTSPEAAKQHILRFYHRYHSSRYVKDFLVIRMQTTLTEQQLATLNKEFKGIVQTGKIVLAEPFPEENENLELPRLVFHHTRKQFGILRKLIDRINSFD